jgi:diguanylate cyclase (GGDEF)-like protein/PAS domain S-box-containing protein
MPHLTPLHATLLLIILALLAGNLLVVRRLRVARRAAAGHKQAAEVRFQSLAQNVSDIITIFEADGTIRYQSPSIERVLGYRPNDLIATTPWFFVHPGDLAGLQRSFSRSTGEAGVHPPVEIRVWHRDGSWRYLESVANNLLDEPSVRGIVVTSRDITERKMLEDRLARQAYYDPLTQLPNRALFMERLTQALTPGAERSGRVAVCFVDLDGFKVVNDSLGHGIGDMLLAAIAQRLATCLKPGDTVARFGGDEFTILMEHVDQPATAVRIGERIIRELRRPVMLADREVAVGASIGLAFGVPGDPRVRPDDLVREADTALYAAKSKGKGRVVVFQPKMNTHVVQRLNLESDLRRAVSRGELRLHYQPEIELRDGSLAGMEALLRWEHPRLGVIGPDSFIPLAEETGLIIPIGQWVLEAACRQARVWQLQRRNTAPLVMSVNLSARQFQQPDLVEQAARVLRTTGLAPTSLKLEITESALMQEERHTTRTLQHLKGLGLQLAIDDFGTGYSSFSYLRQFAVDTLKVDRSFLTGLDRDGAAVAIVQAITSLAHALGMDVTVEGVETAEQLARARTIRCDRGQGYFFSKPLPSDALSEIIRPVLPAIRQAS